MGKERRKKVGILGGTFDPIHTGHLILAEEACEAFSLDYVLIMPNGNPPHKAGQVHASMAQRTRMAELAVADNPHLRVSDFEKTPQDYHYTYETLEFLAEQNPDTEYYFILGADSLSYLRLVARGCYLKGYSKMKKQELVEALTDYWPDREQQLVRLLHHTSLDAITTSLARLPALLEYEDLGPFLAEVNQISTLIEHIWDSELPLIRNLI